MSGPPEYVTTDELLDEMRRELRADGVDMYEVDERIAAELEIPVEWLRCYGQAQVAAERYQARRWAQIAEARWLDSGRDRA